MKKRLASMLLVICCLLSMVGCGGEPTEPVENNGGSSAPVQADAVEDSNAEVTPSLDDVDLSPYFDEETSELIKAFPGVSSLNLSTTIYDEEYDHEIVEIDELYEMINYRFETDEYINTILDSAENDKKAITKILSIVRSEI